MANQNSMMASLELLMWRPTPQKPDIVGGSPVPGSGEDYSTPESSKTMFLLDLDNEHASPLVMKQNGGCAFEGCASHRKVAASTSTPAKNLVEFKHRITMNTVTESALSLKLALWWRPTPQRPDLRASEPGDIYEGAFLLGHANNGYESAVELGRHANYGVTARLAQLGYSATARMLELTITVNLPW